MAVSQDGTPTIQMEDVQRQTAFAHTLVRMHISAWLFTAGVLAVCAGIPVVFAVADEDRLRMSDDFAAMTSAAMALILTLGFLEMDRSLKRAQGRADLEAEARRVGREPSSPVAGVHLSTEASLRLGLVAVFTWIVASILMCAALVLIFLWAAIDGHGPARWLAWYVTASTALGLGGVLLAAVAKTIADMGFLISTYMRAIVARVLLIFAADGRLQDLARQEGSDIASVLHSAALKQAVRDVLRNSRSHGHHGGSPRPEETSLRHD
ncbi:hypothetical protein ACFYY3_14470 [Streptomyces sp. NPDC001812]|uniref:hypothetical protein n=1 Tax=Streptomyces sp. NPDC001812 TaxID=3364611 RepID=UPI00368D24F3